MIRAYRSNSPTIAGNAALGITQILLWGGSFFLIAVVGEPVVRTTGWPQGAVVGALSLAILISGVLSPWVGGMIRRHGGRLVLVCGSLIIAAGLILMALAPNLPAFLAAWIVVGVGMAGALYDPLFAAIGQAYGTAARGAMTQIAIASGFAVTVCWPATSYLVEQVGWRGACLAYAGLAALVVAPLYAWALPPHTRSAASVVVTSSAPANRFVRLPGERILAITFTTSAVLMTAVSVQLLFLLQAQGLSAAAAVGLSALIGPSQVGVRVLELAFGRRTHPLWTLLISSASVAVGFLLLATAPSHAWLAIILYGMGNGMRTVVRGTLPLALYGQQEYATVIGRMARLPLLGQAATPLACGLVADRFGASVLMGTLLGVAVLNLALSVLVWQRLRSRPS